MSYHLESGPNYVDRDGQRKTFTVIDHSPKASIGTLAPIDLPQVLEELSAHKQNLIYKILSINPYFAGDTHRAFVKRGADQEKLEWYEEMITDPGLSVDFLRSMLTFLENRQELHKDIF